MIVFLELQYYLPNALVEDKKYLDSAFLLKYDDDDYSKGCGQIRGDPRALSKDDIFQPYISDNELRSSKIGNEIGYSSYVFDI